MLQNSVFFLKQIQDAVIRTSPTVSKQQERQTYKAPQLLVVQTRSIKKRKWLEIVTYTMIMLHISHEVHSLQCCLHLKVTKLLSD